LCDLTRGGMYHAVGKQGPPKQKTPLAERLSHCHAVQR
jgi:hypothetical protein